MKKLLFGCLILLLLVLPVGNAQAAVAHLGFVETDVLYWRTVRL